MDFPVKYIPKTPAKSGFALITVVLLSALLLLLASSFVFITVSDLRISESQLNGIKAYYWAEAGINKAVWKLINDDDWRDNFLNDPVWSANLNQAEFDVTVQNTDLGQADITAVGKFDQARRIVKTKVIQAIGEGLFPELGVMSHQEISVWNSDADIEDGSLHANQDITLQEFSDVDVEEDASSGQSINIDWSSNLQASTIIEGADPLALPALDFESLKNQATQYTQQEFADLLQSPLTISGITYVDGDVELGKGQRLTVNGLLLAENNITIGENFGSGANSQLTINWTPGNPAGIVAKRNIWLAENTGQVNIEGVIYANNDFIITKFFPGLIFNLEGGIISHNIIIATLDHSLDIEYNQLIINDILEGGPTESPIIDYGHWEEEY